MRLQPTTAVLERSMRELIVLGMVLLGIVFPSRGQSFYPARLDDPNAVYLTHDQFPVRGDGNADDSAAIQAAIDKTQETTGEGILFIPEGRYRVTRTIYVCRCSCTTLREDRSIPSRYPSVRSTWSSAGRIVAPSSFSRTPLCTQCARGSADYTPKGALAAPGPRGAGAPAGESQFPV